MTTTTAETRKLYQQVALTLGERIDAGVYPRGKRLPAERELAEEFGVSRPTIREAMIALEIRGYVGARQGSGIYVNDPSERTRGPAELDIGAFELTEARRIFEGEACALAAAAITDAELERLETLLGEMIRENEGDVAGERADRNFHVSIAQATRNSAIVYVVENLWDLRYKSPLCAAMLSRARQAGSRPLIDDHVEIVRSLRSRDPVRARNAMRAHLSKVMEDLLIATELDAVERARSEVTARRDELARRAAV